VEEVNSRLPYKKREGLLWKQSTVHNNGELSSVMFLTQDSYRYHKMTSAPTLRVSVSTYLGHFQLVSPWYANFLTKMFLPTVAVWWRVQITCTMLIVVQRDATQSGLFIILQVHSTCFGCQPHPSPRVHKTVTTVSGTCHIFLCSYLPPKWPS